MRQTYHDQLSSLTDGLVEMSRLAAEAVERATSALLEADLRAAEDVVSGDTELNALYHQLDALTFDVLARQQPVASDLRTLVTSLRMSSDLERAGDYAVHIAKVARRRYPVAVVPPELTGTIRDMAGRAASVTRKAGEVIRSRDLELARQLLDDDDHVDALHRSLFHQMLGATTPLSVEEIIDITLVGRYYERLADHAVAVSRAVSYLVTGRHVALTA